MEKEMRGDCVGGVGGMEGVRRCCVGGVGEGCVGGMGGG